LLLILFTFTLPISSKAQQLEINRMLKASDTLNKKRLSTLLIGGGLAFAGSAILLNNVWYKDYPRSKFHFFDDNKEWRLMDKGGHVLTTYVETMWAYDAFRWAGVPRNKAVWASMATGTAMQLTIEILDGYSAEWGFSKGDFYANTAGCTLFGLQQALWDEQRIWLKFFNFPKKYDNTPVKNSDGTTQSVREMAKWLYGNNYTQTFFKDYNALTWWISVNPRSFFKQLKFPSWLNLAVGYSAENVFGAYGNYFPADDQTLYPRYSQYLFSFDIDLTKIKTNNKFLKTLCRTFNFVKIPAPALEYNSLKRFKFHPFYL
jgi:hypothetical protein